MIFSIISEIFSVVVLEDLAVANAPAVAQGQPVPAGQAVEWVIALEGGTPETVSEVANAVAAELDGAEALHYRFVFGTSR